MWREPFTYFLAGDVISLKEKGGLAFTAPQTCKLRNARVRALSVDHGFRTGWGRGAPPCAVVLDLVGH